ncbi:hypothetical protein D8L93_01555 [Sodalis-like symbiont of Bactericera trigonica]|nr:hypothetical protein D8L93_01555 [Sodalis-like symbiont of Bactericera trigonica]
MGKAVILPCLDWRGLTPGHIYLSHSHEDHLGGLDSVRRVWPAGSPVSSPFRAPGHRFCLRGQRWQGLYFEVLWPPEPVDRAGNNDSCVLRIDDGHLWVLLTGDIEAQTERGRCCAWIDEQCARMSFRCRWHRRVATVPGACRRGRW